MENNTRPTEFTSDSFDSLKGKKESVSNIQSGASNDASQFESMSYLTPLNDESKLYKYSSDSIAGKALTRLSKTFIPENNTTHAGSAFAGFLALLLLTCANYMLSPMRDAAALAIGVDYIPLLTLASTILALGSSVPVGWLFEAPNPDRKGIGWRGRVGLTRGETQGTSLALFYRVFALTLIGYAVAFKLVEIYSHDEPDSSKPSEERTILDSLEIIMKSDNITSFFYAVISLVKLALTKFGKLTYVAFFLVVHLMKLHSLSLLWGVTSEAMEYEELAEAREKKKLSGQTQANGSHHDIKNLTKARNQNEQRENQNVSKGGRSRARLKRLAFVGFGGTLGGILGSVIASSAAHILHLSGLLIVAATLLELSAELSVELGQIMLRHWQDEQLLLQKSLSDESINGKNFGDNSSNLRKNEVDSSVKRVASLGSMKRIASGSGINSMTRAKSTSGNLQSLDKTAQTFTTDKDSKITQSKNDSQPTPKQLDDNVGNDTTDENSFRQRLLRGVTTILRSRLLMTIFTYNALYATTSVLLSFQRAELVANRSKSLSSNSSVDSDTAFLARINMASSVAVFALQASGLGAWIASTCGQRGTLALMPLIRLAGALLLAWWHIKGDGKPPNLTLFLMLDEFTKVVNFAVAKPVRESLWRGLSNEARYEAKPIVDTLANRWGGGSAAFLTSLLDRIMDFTGIGEVNANGNKSLLGFPPILILCSFSSVWWAIVSTDLGQIRHRIDLELKKQQ